MKKIFLATFVFMFLLVSVWVAAEETGNNPVAVSPGSETEVVTVWQSCPTFSWSAVDQASSYRVAVFASVDGKIAPYESMAVMSSPVISKQIPGPALSWTLPAEERLKTGSMYAWYVQAVDASGNAIGSWSGGRIFQVEQEIRFVGIEEKLGEILKSYGVSEETAANVLNDLKSEVKEVVVPDKVSKTTPGVSGVLGYEGSTNTFYGNNAGASITTGSTDTFIGADAGAHTTTGYGNTFLGYEAGHLNSTGYYNICLGYGAGSWNEIGYYNIFIGKDAGGENDSGNNNVFIGHEAGWSNYSGYNNTFVGNNAGDANSTGNDCTFVGNSAGESNSTGSNNTFIGHSAGKSNNTGIGNLFLGYRAGYNETGSNKLYIDNSNTSSPLIYGEFDNDIVTINGKLGIGTKTPDYQMELETTGENAAFVTNRTDGATTFMNATASYAQFGAVSNHPVRILVNSTSNMMINTDGSLSMASGATCTTGGVWTDASSRALKENIENLSASEAVDALTKLNPVKYNYKVDKTDKHVGFIAEDVPDLVASADRKGLTPMDVTAVLTKVVQELQRENQEYKKIISDLQERMAKLEKN